MTKSCARHEAVYLFMKKIITFVFSLVLATQAWAETNYRFSAECSSGQTLYYYITNDTEPYTVTVSSPANNGTNFYYGYEEPTGDLVIPDAVTYNEKTYSVTSIGYYAFGNCSNLTSVAIPNSVTNIDSRAFAGCSSLTSVIIPNSVTKIDRFTFANCSSLRTVFIPSSVTTINADAFSNSNITFYCEPLSQPVGWWWRKLIDSPYTYYYWNGNLGTREWGYFVEDNILYQLIDTNSVALCRYLKKTEPNVTIPSVVTHNEQNYNVVGFAPKYMEYNEAYASIFNSDSRDTITSITIPSYITTIGGGVFSNCYNLTSVNFGDSIISIDGGAFQNDTSLISITIPNTVTSIGAAAFQNCSNLSSVNIGDSVTTIENYTFSNCTSLKNVTISNSVTSIGNCAFSNCVSLTNVNIPKSVTTIGSWVFSGCSGLKNITIPKSVTTIGSSIFNNDSIIICCEADSKPSGWYKQSSYSTSNSDWNSGRGTIYWNTSFIVDNICYYRTSGNNVSVVRYFGGGDVTIPDKVTVGGTEYTVTAISGYQSGYYTYGAFQDNTYITSVTIPNTVTSIGQSAFYGCKNLTSATLGNSVATIGYSAFNSCVSLTEISIPASVESIGSYAFSNCEGLTKANFASVENLCNIEFSSREANPLYNAKVLYINGTEVTNVTIPSTITQIKPYTFYGDTALISVSVPNTVTTIGSSAFYGCKSMTTVNVPASVTSIGSGAFGNCRSLTSLSLPNSITSIGSYAFEDCRGLTSINIPTSVTTINNGTFSGCTSLTSITIPNGVTTIGSNAFDNCESATSITIPASVTSIGSYAFDDCIGATSITIPDLVETIGSNAFDYVKNIIYHGSATGSPWGALTMNGTVDGGFIYADAAKTQLTAYVGNGGSVSIPDGVVSIGKAAFAGSAVTSVTIPNSVTTIGYCAFEECQSLTSVSIGSSVTRVGAYAFDECDKLKYNEYGNAYYLGNSTNPYLVLVSAKSDTITRCNIHTSTKAIQGGAFSDCENLTSIALPDGITCIEEYTFDECAGLRSVSIPATVNYIGDEAFEDCQNLQSLTLPEAVTFIGEYAFAYCSRLKSINIPAAVDSIGPSAFSSCDSLTAVAYESNFNLSEHKYSWNLYFTKDSLKYQVLNKNEVSVYSNILNAKNVVIPEIVNAGKDYNVVRINGDAFYKYSNNQLESVSIPASVDSIGSNAFNYCNKLREVEFASVESMCKIKFYNYRSNPLTCNAQYSTSNAKLYIAGEEVTDLIIPETIDNIGSYTFYGCKGLNSIAIPATVTKIDEDAFYIASNNGKKTTIYCEAPSKPSGWNSYWVEGYNNYTVVWGRVMRNGLMFELSDDNTAKITGYFGNETSVTIPDKILSGGTEYTVNTIGSRVFKDNADIESVAIPTSVTTIENSAFNGCTSLESIEIHNRMTTIGDSAFYNCYNLTIYCQAKSKPAGWKSKWNLSINDDQIVWNAQMIAVTLTSNNSAWGIVSGSGNYVANRQVTIIATPTTGYHFVKWSDNNTEASRTITVTAALTLTATFEEDAVDETFTVQAIANNAAFGTVTGSAVYTAGTTATLEATPAKGYKFVKWNDENTDNPRQVVVNSYMNFTAFFEKDSVANDTTPKQFMVMAISNNAAYGMVSGSAVYDAGAQAVLAAVATDSCKFVMWSDSVTDNPRTITITADLTLTAIFELASENQGGNEQGKENQGTAVAESLSNSVNIYAYSNTIVVENATEEIRVYNAMGSLVATANDENAEIRINGTGVYIVRTGNVAKRVMIR